ncbi:Maltose O-acetyltransferase [termite gut metagenome]|uniref:Maltose O-acetyltransferase n=1 Tax=termite gut metagenome TaxID=433724 RepID=A0A5J4T224_9ZZZZ
MASLNYLWRHRAHFKFGTKQYFKVWAKRFFLFPNLIRMNFRRQRLIVQGAIINCTAEIGEVNAGGHKQNLIVGANTFLGKVDMALHDKIIIGNHVCINDGVQILTASHDVSDSLWNHIKKPITIEDYVWIATNAIILPGVHIGRGAIVGAGAVVIKNIDPYEIVVGNPAKAIIKKRCNELKYNPCEFLAFNRAWLVG